MKKVKYIITTLILLLVLYMLYSITLKTNEIKEQKESLNKMPNFTFKTLEDNKFDYKELKTNENTLIIYFSTTCIYCENQIEQLVKDYNLLKNTKVLLLSVENKETTSKFIKKYELSKLKNKFTVVLSDTQYFNKIFGYWPKPSLFLYNKDKKMLFVNKGMLKIEALLKYLEK